MTPWFSKQIGYISSRQQYRIRNIILGSHLRTLGSWKNKYREIKYGGVSMDGKYPTSQEIPSQNMTAKRKIKLVEGSQWEITLEET